MTEAQILERADATLPVMNTVASEWTWDEISPTDFGLKIQGVRAASTNDAQKQADYDLQRGQTNATFDELERRKVQGIGMAQWRFRNEAEKLGLVEGVGEYGDAREDILKESEEWAAAWEKVEPTWNPMSTNTLGGFNTLRADALTAKEALTDRKVELRRAGLALGGKLAELQDLNVRWYGQATRAFPEGSEFGDLIRSQIPTFGDNGTPATPTSPTP